MLRYRTLANLKSFEKVVSIDQLYEGMTLIDKYGCKRNVLMITKTSIWLSHKYTKKSRSLGKSHPLETFIEKFPNWIFIPREERLKNGK